MKRLLGLLTNWSEKILSVTPERVQQQARQKANRLLRLVGGNPGVFLSAPAVQWRHDPGQGLVQSVTHKGDAVVHAIKRSQLGLLQWQTGGVGWGCRTRCAPTLSHQDL